jgi:hypothetical protein
MLFCTLLCRVLFSKLLRRLRSVALLRRAPFGEAVLDFITYTLRIVELLSRLAVCKFKPRSLTRAVLEALHFGNAKLLPKNKAKVGWLRLGGYIKEEALHFENTRLLLIINDSRI